MNLNKLFSGKANGNVLPILHLNGYKISAPTISGRKSERELSELIRGFGFTPLYVRATNQDANVALEYAIDDFKAALNSAYEIFRKIKKGEKQNPPFIIMRTDKGMTGPEELNGVKIRGNFKAHQIPLLNAKNDEKELKVLESWLKSYRFNELFNREKGFTL
jgi:xylulose-5-phosphate/fructose-6-phosphate phosphoketolase